MTFASRRLAYPLIAALAAAALVAGCSSAAATPTPSAVATAMPTASPVPSLTAVPTTSPTASPAVNPSARATAPSSPAASTAACAPLPPATALPSDRLTDVQVVRGDTTDGLRFLFGDPSLPGPPSPPTGTLTVAKRPYTNAGSGAPIAVQGEHVLQLAFKGMSLQNDAGQPTYGGPREVKPDLSVMRDAVIYDESEGVLGWYVGYDGPGCVTLVADQEGLLLSIGQR
jgi:hypothetical protein